MSYITIIVVTLWLTVASSPLKVTEMQANTIILFSPHWYGCVNFSSPFLTGSEVFMPRNLVLIYAKDIWMNTIHPVISPEHCFPSNTSFCFQTPLDPFTLMEIEQFRGTLEVSDPRLKKNFFKPFILHTRTANVQYVSVLASEPKSCHVSSKSVMSLDEISAAKKQVSLKYASFKALEVINYQKSTCSRLTFHCEKVPCKISPLSLGVACYPDIQHVGGDTYYVVICSKNSTIQKLNVNFYGTSWNITSTKTLSPSSSHVRNETDVLPDMENICGLYSSKCATCEQSCGSLLNRPSSFECNGKPHSFYKDRLSFSSTDFPVTLINFEESVFLMSRKLICIKFSTKWKVMKFVSNSFRLQIQCEGEKTEVTTAKFRPCSSPKGKSVVRCVKTKCTRPQHILSMLGPFSVRLKNNEIEQLDLVASSNTMLPVNLGVTTIVNTSQNPCSIHSSCTRCRVYCEDLAQGNQRFLCNGTLIEEDANSGSNRSSISAGKVTPTDKMITESQSDVEYTSTMQVDTWRNKTTATTGRMSENIDEGGSSSTAMNHENTTTENLSNASSIENHFPYFTMCLTILIHLIPIRMF